MIAERTRKAKTIILNDLFIGCFALWPLFWNVWGVFRFTATIGTSIPLYTLWMITAFVVLFSRRFKISFLFVWFLFLGVVAIESISRLRAVIFDLSVILCGVLVCVLMVKRRADYRLILNCLYVCGFVISLCVIFDSTLGIFRNGLINFYTEQSREVKLRLTATGGLLPYNASAGCFIYSGLAAYISLNKLKRNNIKRIKNWVVILIFGIAALLIQKRGFIVDTFFAIAVVLVLQIKKEDLKTIRFQRLVKRIFSLIATLFAFALIYYKVPFIRDAVDSLIQRFTASDDIYSGRGDLYELAFILYRGHTWTGIGWGSYRINTLGIFGLEDMTYSVHNVYIQLLCETGIIGLTAFLIAVVTTIIYGMKKYRKLIKAGIHSQERIFVELGLFMQLFFFAYCMSGNPLYDYNFCITYFVGIMLTLAPIRKGT